MAPRGTEIGLVALVTVTVLWAGAAAQSSCTNALISMSPCLNYITGNSSTPSSGCCSQLATVVQSQPQCLCEVLNGGGSSLGISINTTQAMDLPSACNVQTPPISLCNASSPSGTPDSPRPVPSGTGSKNVPTTTTDGDTSDGSSTKLQYSLLFFFFVFAASYTTIFTSF